MRLFSFPDRLHRLSAIGHPGVLLHRSRERVWYGNGDTRALEEPFVLQPPSLPSAFVAPRGTIAGIVLVACGALAVFAMAHHPTVEAHTPAEAIREIGRVGPANVIVHAAMIAIIAALLFALAVFSLRRGLAKEAVLGALVAQAIGSAAMIAAAMISGFVIPDIAARFANAPPDAMKVAVQVIAIGAGTNQLFAKLGVIGMSLAIVLWSADLVRTPGFVRMAGILGFAAGALALGMLVSGVHLTPLTLGVIVLGHALWYCALGALLVRDVL